MSYDHSIHTNQHLKLIMFTNIKTMQINQKLKGSSKTCMDNSKDPISYTLEKTYTLTFLVLNSRSKLLLRPIYSLLAILVF